MSEQGQRGEGNSIGLDLPAEHAQCIVYRYCPFPSRGFQHVSPSVTALTGYTPAECYADPDLACRLVHPEDHGALQQIIEGDFINPVALRFVRQGGGIIWTESNTPVLSTGS